MFWSLPVTRRGNAYILIFTSRFSRRAEMYAVTAAKFTAEGTANVLINWYIALWGWPRSILSDNGLQASARCLRTSWCWRKKCPQLLPPER